jgi:hypothetical protein
MAALCDEQSMSIYIKKINQSENDKCLCQVEHEGATIDCFVYGSAETLAPLLSEEIQIEIGFDRVIEAEIIPEFMDSKSCIKQSEGALAHIIVGRVHSVLTEDSGIYDIYIQNGPEFFCVTSEDWALKPKKGDGVRVKISGLCFYPTNT